MIDLTADQARQLADGLKMLNTLGYEYQDGQWKQVRMCANCNHCPEGPDPDTDFCLCTQCEEDWVPAGYICGKWMAIKFDDDELTCNEAYIMDALAKGV